jgi:hypothetical protein
MFDPSGHSKSVVTEADVVRSSVRRGVDSVGANYVTFLLTREGARHFHRLTRDLAQRGKRVGVQQRFVFEVSRHVYSKIGIDYRAYPQGLNGGSGVQIVLPRKEAVRLARQLGGK